MLLTGVALLSLAIWVYLIAFHGGYWRTRERLEPGDAAARPGPSRWPAVAAVVPARNEAPGIRRSLVSLLEQDYPGPFRVVAVDDDSEDGTGEIARRLAAAHPRGARLRTVTAEVRPAGWVGKMWAVRCGVEAAPGGGFRPEFFLFTDADVEHHPGNLRALVGKAMAERLGLVSLMVMLRCRTAWEGLLIPAFVYFFRQLYPFAWINDPGARTAAAAGGCMLVRADALERAGGVAAVRGEIIDDCALGAAVKRIAPVWLGLTAATRSFRAYGGVGGIWNMVARTAYTQLRYSPALLAGTVAGLVVVYAAPVLLAAGWPLHRDPAAGLMGAAAWALMAFSFRPTLRLYRCPARFGLALPLAAVLFLMMTVDSAARHRRGAGATWKGRARAGLAGGRGDARPLRPPVRGRDDG